MVAGLDGLTRGLELLEPARRDPALMTPEQNRCCGVTHCTVRKAAFAIF